MGVDLSVIGNHKIEVEGKSYEELANEIKERLDSIVFPNPEFLRQEALCYNYKNPRKVRQIKTKKKWTFEEESDMIDFEPDKRIDLYGPYNLEITFEKYCVRIWDGGGRYSDWFLRINPEERNEWRKYFYMVVNAFGGDKVIYLPDNMIDLSKYTDFECSFEEQEKILLEAYGMPKLTIQEMIDTEVEYYMIDHFTDIDWESNYTPNYFTVEPTDKSPINYNLEKLNSKEKLQALEIYDKTLLHKKIDDKIFFYHLETINGLLIYHHGLLGKTENLKLKLDEYAPFVYDEMKIILKAKGYSSGLMEKYVLEYIKEDVYKDIVDIVSTPLLWSGYGYRKYAYSGIKEISTIELYLIDEDKALEIILNVFDKLTKIKYIKLYKMDINSKNLVFEKKYQ